MNNKLIHKVYFLLCILEEFGFIASASCSTELTDFKITETVQRPNFCSFCGTLEEALQLAASPDLAAAHVQMRADGRGENVLFPAELMEISSLSSQQCGQSSLPRAALLVGPSSKQHTEEEFVDFIVLESCVPACQDCTLHLYVICLGAGSSAHMLQTGLR